MKKTLVTLIVIMVTLVACMTTVEAVGFGVKITPSATEVKRGETVALVIAVNNLDLGDKGLTAIYGIIDYDKTVFNTLKVNTDESTLKDGEKLSGWDIPVLNPNNGKMIISRAGYAKTDCDVVKILFTVKDNATLGATTITFKDIKGTDNDRDIASSNVSCTLQIKEKTADNTGDNNGGNNGGNNGSNSGDNNGGNNSGNNTGNNNGGNNSGNNGSNSGDNNGGNTGNNSGNNNGGNNGGTTLKPTVKVSKEKVANGMKVTLTSSTELKAMADWELSADKKTLTRVYTSDFKGTITIKDANGIESDPIPLDVELGSTDTPVDKTAPTASVKYKKGTDGVTVTVTANEQIKPITGWTLSADQKTLTRLYKANTTVEITLIDLAGNKSQPIEIKVDMNLPNGGEDQNGAGGQPTSPDQLPKAGVAYIIPAIALLSTIGVVAYRKYKSMEY